MVSINTSDIIEAAEIEPLAKKILSAMNDSKWDYRTVHGLSRDVQASESAVQSMVVRYRDIFAKAPLASASGESLYYLRSKKNALQLAWDIFRATR